MGKKTPVQVSGRFMSDEVSTRQKEIADAMGIEIKTLSIGEKLKMRKEWVDRHPGVNMVQTELVHLPESGAGRYYKDITEVNICSYKGVDGIIITERNDRVRVVLFNGASALIKPTHKRASFKYLKDRDRIRFITIDGSSISGERVVGTAYGWMLDALPEDIVNYEVNCMDLSGSIKSKYGITNFNFAIDNLEFVTGGTGGRNNLHKNMWMSMWREDIANGVKPKQYKFSAYDIKVV